MGHTPMAPDRLRHLWKSLTSDLLLIARKWQAGNEPLQKQWRGTARTWLTRLAEDVLQLRLGSYTVQFIPGGPTSSDELVLKSDRLMVQMTVTQLLHPEQGVAYRRLYSIDDPGGASCRWFPAATLTDPDTFRAALVAVQELEEEIPCSATLPYANATPETLTAAS